MFKMRFSTYVINMLFFLSCSSSKPVAEKETEAWDKEIPASERIVFINLKIATDSIEQVNRVTLLNKTITNGHLKNNDGGAIRSTNVLTCILYEDGRSSDTVLLQHPLFRVYEYKNEKEQMMLKESNEKEATFFLRYQLKGKTAQLKILESIQGSNQKEIALIKLY